MFFLAYGKVALMVSSQVGDLGLSWLYHYKADDLCIGKLNSISGLWVLGELHRKPEFVESQAAHPQVYK